MENTDYIKVSFNNTDIILEPETQNLQSLPNGYTLVMQLPPQTREALSEEAV